MPKYVAKRSEVCGGQLLQSIGVSYKIIDESGKELDEQDLENRGITKFSVSCGKIHRGMLFNVNDNGLSNDLIYTTPTNYPIESIQPKIEIVESPFIIKNFVELEELLKFLNYGVDLTQHDLNQIYRKLIKSRRWLEKHRELFGWVKNGIGYSSGGIEILPKTIYDNLSEISIMEKGKPSKEEPCFEFIKRKSLF